MCEDKHNILKESLEYIGDLRESLYNLTGNNDIFDKIIIPHFINGDKKEKVISFERNREKEFNINSIEHVYVVYYYDRCADKYEIRGVYIDESKANFYTNTFPDSRDAQGTIVIDKVKIKT